MFLELFSVHLTIWISALRTVIPPCMKGVTCCLDRFFHSVLNKSSCLKYLLPDQRADAITDKLRHASVFKLPHVRTTRLRHHSFVNTLLIITFDYCSFVATHVQRMCYVFIYCIIVFTLCFFVIVRF